MVTRPPAGTIPDEPGSYQSSRTGQAGSFMSERAKSLRSRLSNYFQSQANMHPRTAQMVNTAATVEWIQVRNDVEALMLEYNLIKRHRPRFNVRLIDDKSYPYLAISLSDEWPRPRVMRGQKKKGTRYFGPLWTRLRNPRNVGSSIANVSRFGPVPTRSSNAMPSWANPAYFFTSRNARVLASVR